MSRRWTVTVLAVGVGLTLGLAGCGVGQTAPTSRQLPSVPGVNVDVDGVGVRNALVVFAADGYAPGTDVSVTLTVVNNTAALGDDTATPVRLVDATAGELAEPPVAEVETPEVTLDPGEVAPLTLRVTGLTTAVDGVTALPLVLTFDNGATILLDVPMEPAPEAVPRGTPVPDVGHH